MCSTHFTLSCRMLPFSLPTTKNFIKFVYSDITRESAWRVLFRPHSPAIEGHQNLTHFDSGLLISRTFVPHAESSCTLLYLYLPSCTQKMRWRAHSLAGIVPPFLPFYSFLQNRVCAVYALYEFIVLDSTIRLLYFRVCFLLFPPFVYNCCIFDCTYHSHKSCPSTLAPLSHHSSWTLTSPFSSACLPPLGHVECSCPSRAVDSHISV